MFVVRLAQGKMRLRQYALVHANPDVPERSVACGDVIRRNLRVTAGDLITVKKVEPVQLSSVEVFPIKVRHASHTRTTRHRVHVAVLVVARNLSKMQRTVSSHSDWKHTLPAANVQLAKKV